MKKIFTILTIFLIAGLLITCDLGGEWTGGGAGDEPASDDPIDLFIAGRYSMVTITIGNNYNDTIVDGVITFTFNPAINLANRTDDSIVIVEIAKTASNYVWGDIQLSDGTVTTADYTSYFDYETGVFEGPINTIAAAGSGINLGAITKITASTDTFQNLKASDVLSIKIK